MAMSPASAAGVLECLRTKDAEDTDGRRTTCLILDRGYESPEDVDEGALLRSHEDDPTDVIGAHGGRYFQYPVQSALANASKGVEAVLHEAPDQDAAEVYPSGVQGGPILALQYPTDTPDWVIGAGQKVEPTHGRRLQRIFYRAVRQWDEQDGAYQTFLIMYDPGSRGHQGYCVEALDTKCLPVFALKSEQPLRSRDRSRIDADMARMMKDLLRNDGALLLKNIEACQCQVEEVVELDHEITEAKKKPAPKKRKASDPLNETKGAARVTAVEKRAATALQKERAKVQRELDKLKQERAKETAQNRVAKRR
jgi:hypothetical protein